MAMRPLGYVASLLSSFSGKSRHLLHVRFS